MTFCGTCGQLLLLNNGRETCERCRLGRDPEPTLPAMRHCQVCGLVSNLMRGGRIVCGKGDQDHESVRNGGPLPPWSALIVLPEPLPAAWQPPVNVPVRLCDEHGSVAEQDSWSCWKCATG